MRNWTLLVSFAGLVACKNPEELVPSDVAPDQLEGVGVSYASSGDPEQPITLSGVVAVSGSSRDFTLAIGGDSVGVHTPGLSDLSALNGATLDAVVSGMGWQGERNVLLSDADGPVYFADPGTGGYQADATFGEGFVAFGTVVAQTSDDVGDWTWTTAKFQTDDGPVEVTPGIPAELVIDGATWRVVVAAAYQSDPYEEMDCGAVEDLLAYEMLRVAEAPDVTPLTRPAEFTMANLSCGGS